MGARGGSSAAWDKGSSALGHDVWPATTLTDVRAALWDQDNVQPLLQLGASMGSAAELINHAVIFHTAKQNRPKC